MSKLQKLFDITAYVNTKKYFTARDIADNFNISIRTAHRYLSELDTMGVPLYTETGRNGGYRVLSGRTLPPIIFTEDEALAIFFAFQSLQYYESLPFEVDISSASRKIMLKLPYDVKIKNETLKSSLIFWHRKREINTPLLHDLIQKAIEKKPIKIQYYSHGKLTDRIVCLIGVYSNENLWYAPAFDYEKQEIRLFRADKINKIESYTGNLQPIEKNLIDLLYSYDIKEPVRLFVKLTEKGIAMCQENPYFNDCIKNSNNDSGGYIDTIIDKSDVEFSGRFFLGLCGEAQVIEPLEMKNYIRSFAKKILNQYE